MAIDNIRLPVEVEQGATGGPRFKTSIQTALSGVEQRIAEWDVARCEYDIGYAVRGKATLIKQVIELWRTRHGPAYPFRFKDWTDFEAVAINIGPGDGSTAAFQLVKRYSDNIITVTRAIQLPIEGTVEIEVADVPKTEDTHYTVDYVTGMLTFTPGNIPAADVTIRAWFEFDVPVRFAEDVLNISMTMEDFGDISSIPLIEVLDE
jgi:uncharacterized protein (TIGR02217 family)